MISTSDLIKLPYTVDLTEGGITFACRTMYHDYNRLVGSSFARLRQIVANVSVELAFRRFLTSNSVPWEVENALPFTSPDRYDVVLGGRRCVLNTLLISRRKQISAIRRDSGILLQAPALVPEEQLDFTSQREHDLYMFAFLSGLTAASPDDTRKAANSGQPVHLIHAMRNPWSHPQVWASLGRLALKSECPRPITVELGGLDSGREYITENLSLEPLKRVYAKNNYYSLSYIHVDVHPTARIGLQSPVRDDVYLIHPHEWGNIWVYGLDIWLAGYIPQTEFRRKASTSFTGSKVFQYSGTQTKNLSIPVTDLRPLEDLFVKVKIWEAEKRTW